MQPIEKNLLKLIKSPPFGGFKGLPFLKHLLTIYYLFLFDFVPLWHILFHE